MQTAAAIPFTAWEQAVFVVMFAIILGVMLDYFTRQQGKWQEFISKRDDQWQEFLATQREVDQDRYDGVNQSVQNLTKVTSELVGEVQDMRGEFRAHDTMEREVLRKVQPNHSPKPKTNAKGAKPVD